MKCKKCHRENPDGAKFCMFCGDKVEQVQNCPKCGANDLPVEAQFCYHCGQRLSAIQEPIEQNCGEKSNFKPITAIAPKAVIPDGDEVYLIHEIDYHNIVIYDKKGEAVKIITSNDMCFVHIEEGLYHNTAYVTDGRNAMRITTSGISSISQRNYEMLLDDGEEFVKLHRQYIGAMKIGNSSQGPLFLCYTNKHAERNSVQFADILTTDGKKLFTTGRYVPVGMIGNTDKMLVAYTDSLNLFEKSDGLVNVVDLTGHELLSRPLEKSSYSFNGVIEKEADFGLIFAGDQWAYNVVTNKDVALYNKYIYFSPVNGDELCCDVYSSRTNMIIRKALHLNNTGFHTLAGGFSQIYMSDEHETLIGEYGQMIDLHPREHVCDTLIAHVQGALGHTEPPFEESYISDDRIITTTHSDDSWGYDNILFYRLLDYQGKEIKKINSTELTIKRGFYNAKALFVKDGKNNRVIGYLDKSGNEHIIPYKLDKFDKYDREIELDDIDCEFVSESSVIIRNGYGNDIVIDLFGAGIFKTEHSITKLADGFFYTKEIYSDNIKIYSAKGKFLFESVLYKVKVIE